METTYLPKETWGLIINQLNLYEIVFARATSSTLYKLCKEYRPFPKYFVLDQDKFVQYLIENGFISCLDYVKNALNVEWTQKLCLIAARSGQIETLKYLVASGLALGDGILTACTEGSCDINMIKYLHQSGVSLDEMVTPPRFRARTGKEAQSMLILVPMEHMAQHGHLECMKYAVENGPTHKILWYTPSIECLDYAISKNFYWDGGEGSMTGQMISSMIMPEKLNICEEAAKRGDLTMLKYAHQKGAEFNASARFASNYGHLECLKYVLSCDPGQAAQFFDYLARSLECFKYVTRIRPDVYRNTPYHWCQQIEIGDLAVLRYMLANSKDFIVPTGEAIYPTTQELSNFTVAASLSLDRYRFVLDEAKMDIPFWSTNVDWIHTILDNAVRGKCIDVVKLVWEKIKHKEMLDLTITCKVAAGQSVPEILEFLTQHGAKWTAAHLEEASASANLLNMAYLTRIGCRWNDASCWSKSALCVKYAREHRCLNFK